VVYTHVVNSCEVDYVLIFINLHRLLTIGLL